MQWGPFKMPSENSLCCYVCCGDPSKCLQQIRCAATYAVGTLQNAFNKFAVLLRMQWGPFKMPSKNSLCCYVCSGDLSKCLQTIRCAATYAVGTLQNAFNKFAVLLRMQWGPFKMPSTNSLCCYVCSGDPSKCLQKIAVLLRMRWGPFKMPSKNRCAATYAMGTLKNTFRKFAVLLRMLWGPFKMPSKNRCAATYAVGTLKNTFDKFAVLLRMQWGPFKMPSTNRCAATYAVGTL